MKRLLFMIAVIVTTAANAGAAESRIRQNFDFDWKFALNLKGDFSAADADDSGWNDVQLPHDWSISLDFDGKVSGSVAHLPGGMGWYRKTFTLPKEMHGKKVAIHFDGIFMNSDVWINGKHIGGRPYGFCSQTYDMTPYLKKDGQNVLAVRVDRSRNEEIARWYAGAGIYRHVWLVATEATHIATYGTYITTPLVSGSEATVRVVTSVVRATSKTVTIAHRIIDADGRTVAKCSGTDSVQSMSLKAPHLWTTDNPYLYKMETTLKEGGRVTDRTVETFGVRSIEFSASQGFLLNGKRMKLQGLCLHQDDGSFGCAVPDRAYERRLEILKEYGCNALRMSHNQPSPELLDLCDRMGFVVIDEAFDKWKSGYYAKYFDEWWQRDMNDMLLRDRNHPCIILWSIGNELQEA
ncbi:MAG: sugar-binding domain-containing protein, partial [Prevotella sp.]